MTVLLWQKFKSDEGLKAYSVGCNRISPELMNLGTEVNWGKNGKQASYCNCSKYSHLQCNRYQCLPTEMNGWRRKETIFSSSWVYIIFVMSAAWKPVKWFLNAVTSGMDLMGIMAAGHGSHWGRSSCKYVIFLFKEVF